MSLWGMLPPLTASFGFLPIILLPSLRVVACHCAILTYFLLSSCPLILFYIVQGQATSLIPQYTVNSPF